MTGIIIIIIILLYARRIHHRSIILGYLYSVGSFKFFEAHTVFDPPQTKSSRSKMKIANITEKKGIMIGNGHPLYGPDRMQKHCILKRGRYTNATGPFPSRLHQMLLDADAQGNRSIVSWLPDGRAFRVNYGKKDEFVSKISKLVLPSSPYVFSMLKFLLVRLSLTPFVFLISLTPV